MTTANKENVDSCEVHVKLDELSQSCAARLTGKAIAERVELHKKAMGYSTPVKQNIRRDIKNG